MTWSISKDFEFSAAHHLHGLRDDHPCARTHGHNYQVRVTIQAEYLDNVGFVVDYGDLTAFKIYLDGALDHRDLNEVMDINPTAEHLARRLYEVVCSLLVLPADAKVSVAVSETPKTWAVYTP